MSGNLPILNRKVGTSKSENPSLGVLPERILQIGEGNFLRGYIDWMIYKMNKQGYFSGRVVAVQPTPHGKVVPKLNRQNGLYTLVLRGIDNGELVNKTEVIDSISRGLNPYECWQEALQIAESPTIEFVFSNTTEAGLTYMEEAYNPEDSPRSFPGKLVSLLYHRYQHFQGASGKGWIILPCELVENNGTVLKKLCLRTASYWQFPTDFLKWIHTDCHFCNTLVDRIVTGYPHEEAAELTHQLGYRDTLMTMAEPYHLFVIEGSEQLQEKLPFVQAGLNVYFDEIKAYRECKVKLLNAPHTLMATVAFLVGFSTVSEAVKDQQIRAYLLDAMKHELGTTIQEISEQEVTLYTTGVMDRFANPYLKHQLLDISLNAISKFKTRVLPSLVQYQEQQGRLPKALVFGLAALIMYYRPERREGDYWFGQRDHKEYEIRDDAGIIEKMSQMWESFDGTWKITRQLVTAILHIVIFRGEKCSPQDDLITQVTNYLLSIYRKGIRRALTEIGYQYNERNGDR
jgi:tagaturonate reductase